MRATKISRTQHLSELSAVLSRPRGSRRLRGVIRFTVMARFQSSFIQEVDGRGFSGGKKIVELGYYSLFALALFAEYTRSGQVRSGRVFCDDPEVRTSSPAGEGIRAREIREIIPGRSGTGEKRAEEEPERARAVLPVYRPWIILVQPVRPERIILGSPLALARPPPHRCPRRRTPVITPPVDFSSGHRARRPLCFSVSRSAFYYTPTTYQIIAVNLGKRD